MKILFTLFALLVGLDVGGALPKEASPEVIAKELWIKWSSNEIHVLAYSDERGGILIYDIQNVLLAVKQKNGHWQLIKAVRSWGALGDRREWTVEINVEDNVRAQQEYPNVPTLPDIEAFLKISHWKFEAGSGRFLVAGEVYHEAWKKAFGFEPAYRFPDPTLEIGKPISAESILKSIRYSSEARGYLLAMKAEILSNAADPSYLIERAVILVDLKNGCWELAQVSRLPKDERGRPYQMWNFPVVYDAPYHNRSTYSDLPTEADVELFLKLSSWKFAPESGRKLLKSEIDDETWMTILKFRPKYRFEKTP